LKLYYPWKHAYYNIKILILMVVPKTTVLRLLSMSVKYVHDN